MPFGRAALPTRVYRYDTRVDGASRETINCQLCGAHRYRNRLAEIELARRAAVEQLLRELPPRLIVLVALTRRIDTMRASIRQLRQRICRRIAVPAQRHRLVNVSSRRPLRLGSEWPIQPERQRRYLDGE